VRVMLSLTMLIRPGDVLKYTRLEFAPTDS
jgi:hypothetical protein